VPRGVFSKMPLAPETLRVLEGARTGPLATGPHGWSAEHNIYNEAVGEYFEEFLRRRGIRPEPMTPDDARTLIKEIKDSSDPRIRNFNLKIYLREIMHWMRRAPRRME
jgi:hypothetical protein